MKTLRAEKEDLAAGRTPKTKYGAPLFSSSSSPVTPSLNSSSSNNYYSNQQQQQPKATKLTPLPTTPEAARIASSLDWSRRREFEWDARLHRVAKMDASPNPKLYEYSPSSSTSDSSFSERKPLAPPRKGIRKNDW